MTMKTVEIQIALPRTHEAGKLQEQLQQRGQLQHDLAVREMKKEEQLMKSSVSRNEQKDTVRFHHQKIDSDNRDENGKRGKRGNRRTKANKEKCLNHPYKGNMLDLRG